MVNQRISETACLNAAFRRVIIVLSLEVLGFVPKLGEPKQYALDAAPDQAQPSGSAVNDSGVNLNPPRYTFILLQGKINTKASTQSKVNVKSQSIGKARNL